MSLRPRYSLFTLLVLTALVAGATWSYFKPTRYHFDLAQKWDYADEHEPIENDLRRMAASSARLADGALVYETRRTLFGPREFLVAKYTWKHPPLLAQFTGPSSKRDYFLLTNPYFEEPYQVIQAVEMRAGLTVTSTEKVRCWVSTQIEHSAYVDIEQQFCATGLCHVPAGVDSQARTSYLLTESKKIYQLNQNGTLCALKVVPLSQVASACQNMLTEEIEILSP